MISSLYTIQPTDSPDRARLRQKLKAADRRSVEIHGRSLKATGTLEYKFWRMRYRLAQRRGQQIAARL